MHCHLCVFLVVVWCLWHEEGCLRTLICDSPGVCAARWGALWKACLQWAFLYLVAV